MPHLIWATGSFAFEEHSEIEQTDLGPKYPGDFKEENQNGRFPTQLNYPNLQNGRTNWTKSNHRKKEDEEPEKVKSFLEIRQGNANGIKG